MDTDQPRHDLDRLLQVMRRLRDPQRGCAWDLQQDFRSIAPATLEEAHELVEAIEQNDFVHVREELGDVLFQVIFHAQLGAERQLFDFTDIVHTLVEKLLRRHPHVFPAGDIDGVVDRSTSTSVIEVKRNWESIKQSEREARRQAGILDDIPKVLPALSRARKVQQRVARVGFDWASETAVLAKIEEELAEYRTAQGQSQQRREAELGDLLFSCVNLARHAGIDAEAALRRSTKKFEQRFGLVEQRLAEAGESLEEASLERMDELWEQVKQAGLAGPQSPV